MKFYIILFLVSVNYIVCEVDLCEHYPATSKSDCLDYYNGVDSQGYYCCYSKERYNGQDYAECFNLNSYEYKHIKDTIKNIETDYYNSGIDLQIRSLDCNSYYLQLGIISLIILLF